MNRVPVSRHIGENIQRGTERDRGRLRLDAGANPAANGADAAGPNRAAAAGGELRLVAHHDRPGFHGLNLCLASAERCHFRSGEQVRAIALFQRAKHDTELRVGQNARKRGYRRRAVHVAQSLGQKIVRSRGE